MALHVAVVPHPSSDFETRTTSYFEVSGPAGISGTALAKAMGELGHQDLWPAGDVPLCELNELPDHGMLTLTPFKRLPALGDSATEVLLVVVKGPDCGQHLNLTRGRYSIGRSDCDLHILDPALSRHHADIIVDRTSIALLPAPAVSANQAQSSTAEPQLLSVGDEFVLGGTTFRLCPAMARDSASTTSPPPIWPPTKTTLNGATATNRPWMTLATALLPLGIGIVLALALGSWIFLAFSALGLVTGGVPSTIELASRRKMRRRIGRLSRELISGLEATLPPVGLQSLRIRRSSAPNQIIFSAGHALRIGSGTVMPPLDIDPPTYRGPQIRPVRGPVVVSVPPGGLGVVAGAGGRFDSVVRAITLQLAYSCMRVGSSLVILGRTNLLPAEVRYLSAIHACPNLDSGQAQMRIGSLPPGSVVIAMPGFTDLDRLLSLAGNSAKGNSGPGIILTGIDRHDGAGWTLDMATCILRDGARIVHVDLDGVSRSTMASTAIAAEPEIHTGSTAAQGIDGSVGANVRSLVTCSDPVWSNSSECELRCRIGRSPTGPCELDFVVDGPHVLVVGTTGAGKSELIKAMTTDLLRRYGPDQLALVLLDFKGGSTLSPYAGTPHCQSFITDLNVESGERVLSGLRVELRRREALFRKSNVEDYPGYRRLKPAGEPPLPRLLVIVDEFRILSDELPNAVQELMRIATVGRSLGVHLLLSTQRPQGIVTASMQANINTVISLRLLNPSDSQELLGSGLAAEISATAPGTGFFRRAGEELRPFRSIPTSQPHPLWAIQKIGPGFQDCRTVATARRQDTATGTLASKFSTLASTRSMTDVPVAAFAPPLPTELHLLPSHLRGQRPPGAIALGMADDIDHQRLAALWWTPEKQRRLAIIAGPGSTAHSALLSVVRQLVKESPERHVYVLDGTATLSSVVEFPRVAGYVGVAEPERVSELLDVFDLGARATSGKTATRVLVVNGLGAWSAAMGASDYAEFDDRLAVLARSAELRKACLIVLGDRDLTSSRYLALAEHRLYLRFGLGSETTMGWPKLRNTAPVAGRAVWTSPEVHEMGAVVQLCTPPESRGDLPGPSAEFPIQRCLPLPERTPPASLGIGSTHRGRYSVGVVGPDNKVWAWEPGQVGLVLGSAGSGKTNLISLLADQFEGHFDVCRKLDPEHPRPDVLFLDDVLRLSDLQLTQVDALIRAGTHVVMSAAPGRSELMRLPSVARMLPSSAFLLLNPRQATDGDVPGWRIRPHGREVPGRAVALVQGRLVQVQCAHADVGT